jgi:hypothetical protein
MTCSDDSRAICSAQIEVIVGGRVRTITVTGLFKLGNAYFRFRTGNSDLYAAEQRYFYLSIGVMQSSHATVPLSLPSPNSTNGGQTGLYHHPIMRFTPEIARVEIIAEPQRSDTR